MLGADGQVAILQEFAGHLVAAQTKGRPKEVGKVTVEGQQRRRLLLLFQASDELQQLAHEHTGNGGEVAWGHVGGTVKQC